jgi:hypothetical protein
MQTSDFENLEGLKLFKHPGFKNLEGLGWNTMLWKDMTPS